MPRGIPKDQRRSNMRESPFFQNFRAHSSVSQKKSFLKRGVRETCFVEANFKILFQKLKTEGLLFFRSDIGAQNL